MHRLSFRSNEIEFGTVTFSDAANIEAPDATGCYRCEGIDLADWRNRIDPAVNRVHRFRADLGAPVEDTILQQANPQATPSGSGNLQVVRGSDIAETQTQTLIRFNNLFGDVGAQIPTANTTSADIEKAVLTLTIEGGDVQSFGAGSFCTAYVYRMLTSWDASSASWNALVDGVEFGDEITSDELEGHTAKIPPCDPIGLCDPALPLSALAVGDWRGTRSFDVTADVRYWFDNQTENFGWAILMKSDGHDLPLPCLEETDSTGFRSSDWSVGTEQPTLTVVVNQ